MGFGRGPACDGAFVPVSSWVRSPVHRSRLSTHAPQRSLAPIGSRFSPSHRSRRVTCSIDADADAADAAHDADVADASSAESPPAEPSTDDSAGMMLGIDESAAAGRSCGFAALLGPSNSGKSTLMNLLVGSKVAIVTPKVQTTRCRVAGITVKDSTMIIYLDSPGVFKPTGRLDRAMVRAAWSAANSSDVVAIVIDSAQVYHGGRRLREEGDEVYISEALKEVFSRIPEGRFDYCICLNKIDTVEPDEREEFLACFRRALDKMGVDGASARLFPMSALDNYDVDEFTAWVRSRMPAGPFLYPEDDLTDMPMRLVAAEVTREKVFMLLKQELPYEIAIETTSYKEQKDGSIRITQDILVNRSSQKKIVTGQGGSMVKAIGMASRKELSEMTGSTVHLMMMVKVREKWKEETRSYSPWGLDYNA